METNRTTRDLPEAIDRARRLAERIENAVYVVPTAYGYNFETRHSALPSKYVEVNPDGRAWAIVQEWTNDGKRTDRSFIR